MEKWYCPICKKYFEPESYHILNGATESMCVYCHANVKLEVIVPAESGRWTAEDNEVKITTITAANGELILNKINVSVKVDPNNLPPDMLYGAAAVNSVLRRRTKLGNDYWTNNISASSTASVSTFGYSGPILTRYANRETKESKNRMLRMDWEDDE